MHTTENIAELERGTTHAQRSTLSALMSSVHEPNGTATDGAPAPGDAARAKSALAQALTQGLGLPLLALRATMEALGQELAHERGAYPALRMEGVLREVDRLGKNVRELLDFAALPVPHALACTLAEVVCAARNALAPEQRARVLVARGEPGATVRVDGPLLAGCLRRLLENALEAAGEHVLVTARLEGGQAWFSVIDDARGDFALAKEPAPFRTTKPNHLGLGLALVQRDVALLDGRLEVLRSPSGETCVRIALPAPPAGTSSTQQVASQQPLSNQLTSNQAIATLSIASLSIADPSVTTAEKNR